MEKESKLTFLDLFAGMGNFRLGLEQSGMTCLGYCECDEYAVTSYRAMHNPEGEFYEKDIRDIKPSDLPKADIWCGGFPCQDISLAQGGKGEGLYGSRSSLFFELTRLLEGTANQDKPRWLVIENVRGLLSAGKGRDFAALLNSLARLGYHNEYRVLNSKDFGVPQNRERVFIVGSLVKSLVEFDRDFFPIAETKTLPLSSVMEDKVHERYYISKPKSSRSEDENTLQNNKTQVSKNVTGSPKLIQLFKGRQGDRVYSADGLSCTLTANGGGRGGKTGLYLTDDSRIRRLTPLECFRLQGVPDEYFNRLMQKTMFKPLSETQLYKQTGNAVTVPVIKAIGDRILEIHEENHENHREESGESSQLSQSSESSEWLKYCDYEWNRWREFW